MDEVPDSRGMDYQSIASQLMSKEYGLYDVPRFHRHCCPRSHRWRASSPTVTRKGFARMVLLDPVADSRASARSDQRERKPWRKPKAGTSGRVRLIRNVGGRKERPAGTARWLLADEASGVSIATDRQRGSQTSGDFDFGPGTGAMGGTSNQN